MTNERYNGWTNYPTWRVHLELVDGVEFESTDTYQLGREIKTFCEDYLDQMADDGLVKDFAIAFIDNVNWYEIAEHIQN